MSVAGNPQSASLVDPASIQSRALVDVGAELLVRRRPPGAVNLAHGQREHMLMSSVGSPVDGCDVRSVLRTAAGRREWRSCPQGHVTFVPSGFPMEWDWSYRSESVHLTMLPAFLTQVGDEFATRDGEAPALRPLFRIVDHELSGLLQRLRMEAAGDDLGRDLVTSSLLTLLAIRVYRLSGASAAAGLHSQAAGGFSAEDCRRSIEILSDRLDEKIALSELAKEFSLSPSHFVRVFKLATGLPPHAYQLQLRIARARELLRRKPERTVAEIACELGFCDESHFRRHFRRIVGTTPSLFRQQQ